jgi:hypothetical protein
VEGIGPKRRERIAHAWQKAKQVGLTLAWRPLLTEILAEPLGGSISKRWS